MWVHGCIYILIETIETHDIYDTPAMGTLNGTDSMSDSVSDWHFWYKRCYAKVGQKIENVSDFFATWIKPGAHLNKPETRKKYFKKWMDHLHFCSFLKTGQIFFFLNE